MEYQCETVIIKKIKTFIERFFIKISSIQFFFVILHTKSGKIRSAGYALRFIFRYDTGKVD